MREHDVRQAVTQKIWPTVVIIITNLNAIPPPKAENNKAMILQPLYGFTAGSNEFM